MRLHLAGKISKADQLKLIFHIAKLFLFPLLLCQIVQNAEGKNISGNAILIQIENDIAGLHLPFCRFY